MPLEPLPSIEASGHSLSDEFSRVRRATEGLCEPLEVEDFGLQSMPDASPTKWHLAHTSWFFETFVLAATDKSYARFDPSFAHLFNSYYYGVGSMHARPDRGLVSRPSVETIFDYRRHVDERMLERLGRDSFDQKTKYVIEVGLHHEQQHQELILTDIKHALAANPVAPVYRERVAPSSRAEVPAVRWLEYPEGLRWIGHDSDGFGFDNEFPRHRRFMERFLLGSRLVTCGEYVGFIADGGYQNPLLWLSDAWIAVEDEGWTAPLYWERRDEDWWHMTLAGMQQVDPAEPITHVSYYEADAFARWAGYRLPTEVEWETAAEHVSVRGNFVESGQLHPTRATNDAQLPTQMFGDVWEWTQSPYAPYPRYRELSGALGEYNGKFMCNQMVLRGGSCATPESHIRRTYRNFFHPTKRWQFSGIRLARDE